MRVHSRRAVGATSVVDRAPDGTPLYAPLGELPSEVDGSAVQRHLCGRWYRDLASSHVRHGHGLTATDYRLLAGLRPRHPLQAPSLWPPQRAAAPPHRHQRTAAGRDGSRRNAGESRRAAEQAFRERPAALERQLQLAESGSRLGSARAAAFHARREQRARSLG